MCEFGRRREHAHFGHRHKVLKLETERVQNQQLQVLVPFIRKARVNGAHDDFCTASQHRPMSTNHIKTTRKQRTQRGQQAHTTNTRAHESSTHTHAKTAGTRQEIESKSLLDWFCFNFENMSSPICGGAGVRLCARWCVLLSVRMRVLSVEPSAPCSNSAFDSASSDSVACFSEVLFIVSPDISTANRGHPINSRGGGTVLRKRTTGAGLSGALLGVVQNAWY